MALGLEVEARQKEKTSAALPTSCNISLVNGLIQYDNYTKIFPVECAAYKGRPIFTPFFLWFGVAYNRPLDVMLAGPYIDG